MGRTMSHHDGARSLRYTNLRWLALLLSLLYTLGFFYAYDNPSALQQALQEEFKINDTQFGLLYSVYSLPNIILPIFGGYAIDWLGVRTSLIIYTALIVAGAVLITVGGYLHSFAFLLSGRVLFGLGGESLIVAQYSVIADWFRGKELAFAFSVLLSISRGEGSLNSWISPWLYERTRRLDIPLLVSLGLTVLLSLIHI
eukprot:TRINITY_DN16492_c0_g1_i1.p1 TRINITY_DN16492_c0_g1~~TRINITY_DN16492_c0_g1_i1.p1  ORF type:complete len:199 (-),score=18.60 TRINITY_DN16492_c0_g1_i1:59-655(-)